MTPRDVLGQQVEHVLLAQVAVDRDRDHVGCGLRGLPVLAAQVVLHAGQRLQSDRLARLEDGELCEALDAAPSTGQHSGCLRVEVADRIDRQGPLQRVLVLDVADVELHEAFVQLLPGQAGPCTSAPWRTPRSAAPLDK